MATFNRFEIFSEDLAKKQHDLHADTLKFYLSNATPSASADLVKADLAEISGGNGYTAGGHDTQNTVTRSGLVSSVTGVDIVITAAGGTIGPFRYAVLYNDTHASDALIGWVDYGSAITLQIGENITLDIGAAQLTIG